MIATISVLIDSHCYATTPYDKLYLKAELPIYTIAKRHDCSGSKVSDGYGFGIGYVVSPKIEVELMHSMLGLRFNKSNASTYVDHVERSNEFRDNQLFGFAFPSFGKFGSICADDENTFVTKEEICDSSVSSTTCTNISGQSNSIKLNNLIMSVKFNLFQQYKYFTPYIIAGTGIVLGEAENIKFSKDFVGGSLVKRKRTRSLGFELGVGTKVYLIPKLNLEVNAKYFDYGKHNGFKKINGYKFSAAVVFFL